MKVKITKIRAVKALVFSFFSFLMLGLISIINSGAAYATSTNFAHNYNVSTTLSNVDASAKVNDIVRTEDDGYVVVGSEYNSNLRKLVPSIIKYTYDEESGQYKEAWHKTQPENTGEFMGVGTVPISSDEEYNNTFIIAVGYMQNHGIIYAYAPDGTLKASHTSDVYRIFNDVYYDHSSYGGGRISSSWFKVVNGTADVQQYNLGFNQGAGAENEYTIGFHGSGSPFTMGSGEEIAQYIYDSSLSVHVLITNKRAAISNDNLNWEIEGNFVAGNIAHDASNNDYNVIAATSDGTVKVLPYNGGGSATTEVNIPNVDIQEVSGYISDGNAYIYVLGDENRHCDIGGMYGYNGYPQGELTRNVVYKIQNGTVAYKNPLPKNSSDDPSILAVSATDFVLSRVTKPRTTPAHVVDTVWYTEGEIMDIEYVILGDTPPEAVNCGTSQLNYSEAIKPRVPSIEGYTFDGWYTDEGRTQKVPTSGTYISTDTTLYANWKRNVYTITYAWSDAHPDGINLPSDEPVSHGDLASRPANPSEPEGYHFEGWHAGSCGNAEYDFNTPVKFSMTIIGCWSQDQNTVSFSVVSTDNPSSYSPSNFTNSKTVSYGDTVTLPNPRADSSLYTFNGWYTDPELTHLYKAAGEESNAIKSSFTLYGGWINHTVAIEEGEDGLELVNPDNLSNITFDKETNTLTLDDLSTSYPIVIRTDEPITIVLENDNILGTTDGRIESLAPLTITGDGTLTATAITNAGDLTIEDTTVSSNILGSFYGMGEAENINIKNSNVSTNLMAGTGDIMIDGSNINGINGYPPTFGTENGDIDITNNSIVDASQIVAENGNIDIANDSTVSTKAMEAQDILVKDSTLNVDYPDSTGPAPLKANNITVENGELNLNSKKDRNSEGESALEVEGVFTLNGGSVNLNSTGDANYRINALIIKKGDFAAQSDTELNQIIANYLTEVDGGSLTIKGSTNGNDLGCGLSTAFAIFNDGKINIAMDQGDGEYVFPTLALCVDFTGMVDRNLDKEAIPFIIQNVKDELGIELDEGEYIKFNGGDSVLKGGIGSAAVLSFKEEDVKDTIVVAKGMVQDPEGTTTDLADLEIDTNIHLYINTFSNGKKMDLDPDTGAIVNIARSIHIYPYVAPVVPPVPNTIDYQIIVTTIATLIAVLVEGAIIADLYRRTHGYEEEIAAAEAGNAMMDNQPVVEQPAQAAPEEKAPIIEDIKPVQTETSTDESPAETVEVKINNHDAGDEYYY